MRKVRRSRLSGTRAAVLEDLKASLGDRVHVVPCNLADAAEVERLVPAAEAAMGSLDILVNNAGITRDGLAMRMKDGDWAEVIDVNLTAGLSARPRGDARHDEAPLRSHHRHHHPSWASPATPARRTMRPQRPA